MRRTRSRWLLVERAAPAPPAPERKAPTTKEVADFLTAELPAYYQALLYSFWKGRLDDRGNPTALARGTGARRHGPGPARAKKAEAPAPQPGPDLEPDQPLAAARDRLAAEAREARDRERSPAVEIDLSAIPDPPPTREELLAMGRAPRVEHDHRDREHRSTCRACRATWRRDGADPTQIRP